jgi:two-component system chemotaxis response regulator CheY
VALRKCILLVDDSAPLRRTLGRVFTHAGWDVCGEAEDGKDAIDKAKQFQPSVVLMDLSMPQMNGLDASRALKAIFPSIRIILFTMYGSLLSSQDLASAGVSAVLAKGVAHNVLLNTAADLIEPNAA